MVTLHSLLGSSGQGSAMDKQVSKEQVRRGMFSCTFNLTSKAHIDGGREVEADSPQEEDLDALHLDDHSLGLQQLADRHLQLLIIRQPRR